MDIKQTMEFVVFDLDGTLLSTDSTRVWLMKQLKSHPLRFIGAISIMPIALPLMKVKKYKSIGASFFLWIATFGLNRNQLIERFKIFSTEVNSSSNTNLYWFDEGISELKRHLKADRKIIIVTAAPELLTQELFKTLGLNINVIGTPLKNKMGGWISGIHCRHEEKLKRLKLLGINPPWLATYTDDIEEDYPILINSQHPYLINSEKQRKLNNALKNLHYLEWN